MLATIIENYELNQMEDNPSAGHVPVLVAEIKHLRELIDDVPETEIRRLIEAHKKGQRRDEN